MHAYIKSSLSGVSVVCMSLHLLIANWTNTHMELCEISHSLSFRRSFILKKRAVLEKRDRPTYIIVLKNVVSLNNYRPILGAIRISQS